LATKVTDLKTFSDKKNLKLKEIVIKDSSIFIKGVLLKKYCEIDCVINCCHGGIGENGTLAGFFLTNKVSYVGSSPLSAGITMDKTLTKKLIDKKINTIKGVLVTKENFDDATKKIEKEFKDELIVKPNSLGSSIGVKACTKNDFKDQILAIFELNDDALVEERIVDLIEYNQACFRDKDELVLSAIEQPITKSKFLTFKDKYQNNCKGKGTDRIIPAKIEKKLQSKIEKWTAEIYETLSLGGVVRVDYIFDRETGELYFNEVNTIPGSMAFYLYEEKGIDYVTLIERLIENKISPKEFTFIETGILSSKNI